MGRKIIQARPPSPFQYMVKVWQHRRLIVLLAQRDIKGQFAQSILGWVWLLLRPIATLIIFTLFFDQWLQLDTNNIPYPAFAFSGMIIWYFFSGILQSAGTAVSQSGDLIKKTYFPKLILPLSKVAGNLFEFSMHLLLLVALLLILGYTPSLIWLLAPLFLLPALIVGLMIAVWLNVLTAQTRDLQHIVPYLANFAIWFTPVFYPGTIIPETYRHILYQLNPIACTIEGLRWSIFETNFPLTEMLVGTGLCFMLLCIGIWSFIRQERNMTDWV